MQKICAMIFAVALGAAACKPREFNKGSSQSSISGPSARSYIAFDAVSNFENGKGINVGWCYFNEDKSFQPVPIESGLSQDVCEGPWERMICKTYKVAYTLRQYTTAHKYAITGELELPDIQRTGPGYTQQDLDKDEAFKTVNQEIDDVTREAANRATLGILCSPSVVNTSNPIDEAVSAKTNTQAWKAYNDLVVTCRDGKATSVRKSPTGKLTTSQYQWVVSKLNALSASQSNQTKLSCPQSFQQIDVSLGKLVKTKVCTDDVAYPGRKCVDQ